LALVASLACLVGGLIGLLGAITAKDGPIWWQVAISVGIVLLGVAFLSRWRRERTPSHE
jgi:hypothetical protein